MTDATIRPATAADVADIGDLVRRAYSHYIARIGRTPAPMTADYARLVEDGVLHVLEVGRRIAGAIVLQIAPDHVFVGNVAVDPDLQGQGLGRLLLAQADALAVKVRVPELRLHTHQLMHENLALYRRLGWDEYDRAVQDGFPRVFMRKSV